MSDINQALAAIDAFVLTLNTATKVFRQSMVDAGFTTAEDAKPVVMQWVSKKYACPIVVSTSNRNKGQNVLDRSAKSWMAADQAFKRLMDDLTGDADAKVSAKAEGEAAEGEAEDFDVPAEIAAAAAKLVALVNVYDLKKGEMKKLAARAVADAFAAK
jgi:hypothetical protein